MTSVVLLRGVPGSGKTTASLQLMNDFPDQFVRVNRDDIRMMMFGEYHFTGDDANTKEKAVTQVEHSLIKSAIKAGKRPLVDATNLNRQSVKAILRIAGSHGLAVDHIDFEVSQEEAIKRDAGRSKKVGEDVIKKFFQKNNIDKVTGKLPEIPEVPHLSRIEPVVDDSTLPTAVVVDLDGTICEHVSRSPYDYTKVLTDRPIAHVINVIKELSNKHEIVFLSGRKNSCYDDTVQWLNEHTPFWGGRLFMRPDDSNDPDYVVKEHLFNENINGRYQVVAVFDDRDQVCRLWNSKGLPLFRVGDPDASF